MCAKDLGVFKPGNFKSGNNKMQFVEAERERSSKPGRASRDSLSGDDCARTAKGAVQPAKQPADDGVGICTDFLISSRC